METRAAMERGLASRWQTQQKILRTGVHRMAYMTAAHAGERGLVDLGAEAGKSWPIICETFGKLRISSTERTQGNAVRLAMPRSGRQLERTHWKLWENSRSTWMRHGVDSHETLGRLGLPRSGGLLAEGKLAKTLWEVMSMHDRCTCKGTWFGRPGGRGRQKLANHMGNFWETQTLKHRAHPRGRSSTSNGAQWTTY